MARKRRTKAKRRSPRRMGDGRATARRRTRRRSRRKGMSEVFTSGGVKKGAKSTLIGIGGGVVAKGIDLVSDNEIVKGGLSLVIAFAASAMGAEHFGAGLAGGWAFGATDRLEKKFMSDFNNANYTDEDALNDYPDALSDDGIPLYLGDDGYYYFSDDFHKNDDGTYTLSDGASPYDANMAVVNY